MMKWIGEIIMLSTDSNPLIMGIVIAVIVGIVLTLPISSAALCLMLELDGLAAGAATIGCCAQMIGFATISFKDNGLKGILAQGLGTSMLQVPNIYRIGKYGFRQLWLQLLLVQLQLFISIWKIQL